jgi:hypothetical protein
MVIVNCLIGLLIYYHFFNTILLHMAFLAMRLYRTGIWVRQINMYYDYYYVYSKMKPMKPSKCTMEL